MNKNFIFSIFPFPLYLHFVKKQTKIPLNLTDEPKCYSTHSRATIENTCCGRCSCEGDLKRLVSEERGRIFGSGYDITMEKKGIKVF